MGVRTLKPFPAVTFQHSKMNSHFYQKGNCFEFQPHPLLHDGQTGRKMLDQKLWKSSSLENQLLSDVEISVLQRGAGLGALDSESQGLWLGSSWGQRLHSTTTGWRFSPRPQRAPARPLLRPLPAQHPGLGKGRARPEGRSAEEGKDVVGSWGAGRGCGRGGGGGAARGVT